MTPVKGIDLNLFSVEGICVQTAKNDVLTTVYRNLMPVTVFDTSIFIYLVIV